MDQNGYYISNNKKELLILLEERIQQHNDSIELSYKRIINSKGNNGIITFYNNEINNLLNRIAELIYLKKELNDMNNNNFNLVFDNLYKTNDLLRSAYQIAKREGESTNWEGFLKQLNQQLQINHEILYNDDISNNKLKAKWTPDLDQDLDSATLKNSPFYDQELSDAIIKKYGSIQNFKYSIALTKLKQEFENILNKPDNN